MPVLRVNICNQSIAFALQYFLPLAHRLRKEAPSDVMRQKTFITISVSHLLIRLCPYNFWDIKVDGVILGRNFE